ncbi:MAG: hypothetical protein M0C28_45805 [Candidatus Moduliflexus flocculans]|nr:hypothetical protein [Candidatus Moduliflexus flocculans]
MVAVAEPDMAVSSTDVAVIKTTGAAGTTVGAVYRPVFETVPHSDPVPPEPDTLHVTLIIDGVLEGGGELSCPAGCDEGIGRGDRNYDGRQNGDRWRWRT